jgi:hypothetical protein
MGSTRPFASLTSLALLALSLVVLLPDCASACMCAVEGGPKERAREAIAGSDAVFSGEVVELEKAPPDTEMIEGTMLTVMGGGGREATVTLRVSEVWKGPKQQTVQFTTPVADGISCAHPFKEGREYLVYAHAGQGLRVDGCSETKRLPRRTQTSPCSETAARSQRTSPARPSPTPRGRVGGHDGRVGGPRGNRVSLARGAAPARRLGCPLARRPSSTPIRFCVVLGCELSRKGLREGQEGTWGIAFAGTVCG